MRHFRLRIELAMIEIFPFKQTLVILTPEITQSPTFLIAHYVCLADMRILSYQAL